MPFAFSFLFSDIDLRKINKLYQCEQQSNRGVVNVGGAGRPSQQVFASALAIWGRNAFAHAFANSIPIFLLNSDRQSRLVANGAIMVVRDGGEGAEDEQQETNDNNQSVAVFILNQCGSFRLRFRHFAFIIFAKIYIFSLFQMLLIAFFPLMNKSTEFTKT